jgi:AcrR family transcriptional regulator
MDLYSSQGYDETTVAQIAAHAGLTERTFFRHFKDKREVLFAGSSELEQLIVASVTGAPPGTSSLEAATAGIEAAGSVFSDERRTYAAQRRAVIRSNPELLERELIKMSSLTAGIAGALRQRGVRDPAASLAAEAAAGVYRVAFERWTEPGNHHEWRTLVRRGFKEFRELVASEARRA